MKGSFSEYDPKTGKHKTTFFGPTKPKQVKPEPPPPDPFEEAWNEHCGRYQGPTPYATFKDGWNAAIKFAAAKL